MTVTIFLVILSILEVITPLVTEAVKKLLDGFKFPYACNVLVLIDSFICTALAMSFYYVNNAIPLTAVNIFYIVFMFIANWLGSMLGYDKVKQAIDQLIKK